LFVFDITPLSYNINKYAVSFTGLTDKIRELT
jgi:hypothetical protein